MKYTAHLYVGNKFCIVLKQPAIHVFTKYFNYLYTVPSYTFSWFNKQTKVKVGYWPAFCDCRSSPLKTILLP